MLTLEMLYVVLQGVPSDYFDHLDRPWYLFCQNLAQVIAKADPNNLPPHKLDHIGRPLTEFEAQLIAEGKASAALVAAQLAEADARSNRPNLPNLPKQPMAVSLPKLPNLPTLEAEQDRDATLEQAYSVED